MKTAFAFLYHLRASQLLEERGAYCTLALRSMEETVPDRQAVTQTQPDITSLYIHQ